MRRSCPRVKQKEKNEREKKAARRSQNRKRKKQARDNETAAERRARPDAKKEPREKGRTTRPPFGEVGGPASTSRSAIMINRARPPRSEREVSGVPRTELSLPVCIDRRSYWCRTESSQNDDRAHDRRA